MNLSTPIQFDSSISTISYDIPGNRMAVTSNHGPIQIFKRQQINHTEWTFDSSIPIFNERIDQMYASSTNNTSNQKIKQITWSHPEFGSLLACIDVENIIRIFEEHGGGSGGAIANSNNTNNNMGIMKWRRIAILLPKNSGEITQIQFSPRSCGLLLGACGIDGRVAIYSCSSLSSFNEGDGLMNEWNLTDIVGQHDYSILNLQSSSTRWSSSSFTWCDNAHDAPALAIAIGNDVMIWQLSIRRHEWVLRCQFSKSLLGGNSVSDNTISKQPISTISWARNLGRSFHCIATGSGDVVKIWKICVVFPNNETSAILNIDDDHHSTSHSLHGNVKVQLLDQITLPHQSIVHKIEWNTTVLVLATSYSSSQGATGNNSSVKLWHANLKGQFIELGGFNSSSSGGGGGNNNNDQ
jgi:hypothetical protein